MQPRTRFYEMSWIQWLQYTMQLLWVACKNCCYGYMLLMPCYDDDNIVDSLEHHRMRMRCSARMHVHCVYNGIKEEKGERRKKPTNTKTKCIDRERKKWNKMLLVCAVGCIQIMTISRKTSALSRQVITFSRWFFFSRPESLSLISCLCVRFCVRINEEKEKKKTTHSLLSGQIQAIRLRNCTILFLYFGNTNLEKTALDVIIKVKLSKLYWTIWTFW